MSTILTKDFLHQEYIVLDKTASQISSETGLAKSTITQKLSRYKIYKGRNINKVIKDIPKDKLIDLYCIQLLNLEEIAEIYQVSSNTVGKRLRNLGIEIRPHKIPIVGRRFGRLEVKEFVDKINLGKKLEERYRCECKCGKIVVCYRKRLLDGRNTSCGCANRDGNLNRHFKGYHEISGEFFSRIARNARRWGRVFEIKIEEIWDLFLKQNRKCALSGKEISFKGPYKASLDRIDSTKGYTIDNVQWIYSELQFMKRNKTDKEFISLCKEVAGFNV